MALDQITVEYNANIDKLKTELSNAEQAMGKVDQTAKESGKEIEKAYQRPAGILQKLQGQLKILQDAQQKAFHPASVQSFQKKIDETRGKIQALTGQVQKTGPTMIQTFKQIGAAVGIAFSVQQLISFGKELINLAMDAEEVKSAFKKLNNPGILDQVRKAVSGTVDDVTLMKSILKADSLTIPLEELALLFEFAERKAGALGLTTEQTFESIIQAIGARSPKAFTTLGISVFEVQEKLKGLNFETATIADVSRGMSEIFRSELDKMGAGVDSNSDKVERGRAAWKNFRTELGGGFLKVIGFYVDVFEELNNVLSSNVDELGALSGAFNKFSTVPLPEMGTLDMELLGVNQKLEKAQKNLSKLFRSDGVNLPGVRKMIASIKEEIEALESQKATLALKAQGTTIQEVENKIASYKEELKDANSKLPRFTELTNLLSAAETELAILTGNESEAMKKNREEREKAIKEKQKDVMAFAALIQKAREMRMELFGDSDIETAQKFGKLIAEASKDDTGLGRVTGKMDEQQKERFAKYLRDTRARFELEEQTVANRLKLLEFEREEELRNADLTGGERLVIIRKYAELENQVRLDQLDGELQIAQSIGLAMGSLFQSLSKDSSEYAEFQKAMALFQIAVDSAQAISAAVRVATTSSTNPIQAAIQIAATIALVLANIARARTIVEGADVPQFAEGEVGLKGPGTTKSDSIAARLSRGESVITAEGTALDPDLLRAMNKGPIDFNKYVQHAYVWPYMEAMLKAHSKVETKGMTFSDRNILKRLDTGNKLQIKTTQALINALNKKQSKRRYWN